MNETEFPETLNKDHYPRPTIFLIIFVVLSLLDIIGTATNLIALQISAKPLLIPVLIIYLFYSFPQVAGKWMIYVALIFSTLGDIFLLFEFMQPSFFIFGVAAFLLAHVFYISYFFRIKSYFGSLFKKQPWWLLLIYSYCFGLLLLIFPGLGDMEIPVTIYAIVLSAMLFSSVHVYLKVQSPSNKYFVAGAILFVLSDSMLAINKFYHHFPMAGVLIMLTYCAAQYLLVQGVVSQKIALKPKEWWED